MRLEATDLKQPHGGGAAQRLELSWLQCPGGGKRGGINGSLVAVAERELAHLIGIRERDAVGRTDDEIACGAQFVALPEPGIEVVGEELRARQARTQRAQDPQFVIHIAAEHTHGHQAGSATAGEAFVNFFELRGETTQRIRLIHADGDFIGCVFGVALCSGVFFSRA